MKFISIKTHVAKYEYRCSLCGEIIKKDDNYTNAKYPIDESLRHLKCHNECFFTAERLKLLERDSISTYMFIKKCREYIYDVYIRAGAKVTKAKLETIPISRIVFLIHKYFDEEEASRDTVVSPEVTRLALSVFAILFAMPTLMDNLVYELDNEGRYTHKVKSMLTEILKDFEEISDRLFKIYDHDGWADEFSASGLDALEKVDNNVMIEGADKYANIFVVCVKILVEKWELINKQHASDGQLAEIKRIHKRIKDTLTYTEYSFIEIITRQYMGGDIIKVKD